ncbi:hypothetical protein EDB86DRAFT_2905804 [Lactarius hatsudake]|nr:hypothetical protein EDB86DRAFT_2905804 [Lactarius hatsudake]
MANWWVVVGEQSTRQLLSIKRVTVSKSLNVKLEFTPPKGQGRARAQPQVLRHLRLVRRRGPRYQFGPDRRRPG